MRTNEVVGVLPGSKLDSEGSHGRLGIGDLVELLGMGPVGPLERTVELGLCGGSTKRAAPRRCPAEAIEQEVLGAIAGATLPESAIDTARVELRRRVETPGIATAGRTRARLANRLEQLKKQHSWGDISDADYISERDATRAALAELPDGDRIRAFDAYRVQLLALPDAIGAASPARREELCRLVVERVVVDDRRIDEIVWTPPARPAFESQRECPQGDSNP